MVAMRKLLCGVLAGTLLAVGIALDLDEEYARGWGSASDTSLGQKFRHFARSQLSFVQMSEGEGAEEGEGFDVELLGKLKMAVGGPEGVLGPVGPQGPAGETGVTGLIGIVGEVGENGPLGEKGNLGDQTGVTGVTGDDGKVGKTGPVGKVGETGPQGIPGIKGPMGDEGPRGTQAGPQGLRGSTGQQGPPGKMGPIGMTGPRGAKGVQGPQGHPGQSGAIGQTGVKGKIGGQGAEGVQGPKGPEGEEGVRGDRGEMGAPGKIGVTGDEGVPGEPGEKGDVGIKGVKGLTGANGEPGIHGPTGLKGDKGAIGLPGQVGIQGPVGKNGFVGAQGVEGAVGDRGPIGGTGLAGPVGDFGKPGEAGPIGPIGTKGDDFKYAIEGPTAFSVGLGGDRGMLYSNEKGFSMEHSESPIQIRFVQKVASDGKSTQPAIISGYLGNVGIGTQLPTKELEVQDKCLVTDAECANRKGPLTLSASWRNVIMSKVQGTYYDMIGAYTNWAKGESSVYLGAHDSQATPATKGVERVYFGGSMGSAPPVTRFENFVGKFYATKFVQVVAQEDTDRILEDADVFLDMAHTAKNIDLSHMHVALHAKSKEHSQRVSDMRTEVSDMLAVAKRIKARLGKR